MHQFLKFIPFDLTLYMFRMVFPSIVRSSRLHIKQQLLLPAASGNEMELQLHLVPASKQAAVSVWHIRLLLYVQSWTPDDGRKDRPKHVEC
jgi:hypothetical protein